MYQRLVISNNATPSRRWTDLFFGGSGSGPSRGAFPFSTAENLLIGAIGFKDGDGAKEKKQAEQEEMDNGALAPSHL